MNKLIIKNKENIKCIRSEYRSLHIIVIPRWTDQALEGKDRKNTKLYETDCSPIFFN